MNAIILLFLIGILFLVVEVFMPGAILGILGVAAMIAGSVLSFNLFGIGGGLVASAVAAALLGLALYLEFVLLPKTKLGGKLFVKSTVSSTSQAPVGSDDMIGREAEALTTLAPSGVVAVDGKRYEAFCRTGHAPKGARLLISGRDNFRLIVTQIS
jgi:membrane-bound ClpP family serine protease